MGVVVTRGKVGLLTGAGSYNTGPGTGLVGLNWGTSGQGSMTVSRAELCRRGYSEAAGMGGTASRGEGRVQGEWSCHAVLTDCCMVANRKGPVRLSKEPGVEAKGDILSGAQSKGAMPTVLEGGLSERMSRQVRRR